MYVREKGQDDFVHYQSGLILDEQQGPSCQPHSFVKGRHGQSSQVHLQTEMQRALGVVMELSPAGRAGVLIDVKNSKTSTGKRAFCMHILV